MADAEALLEPLIPALRRYAYALVRDHDAADDLVQDTLARACEKAHLFRPGSDLRAWLFALMHNLSVNQWKAQRARESVIDPHADAESAGDALHARAPDRPVDEMIDLREGLTALSEEHRQVLLLVCVAELSYAEVADVIGVPIGTVMSRLHRARNKLRERLEDYARERGLVPAAAGDEGGQQS